MRFPLWHTFQCAVCRFFQVVFNDSSDIHPPVTILLFGFLGLSCMGTLFSFPSLVVFLFFCFFDVDGQSPPLILTPGDDFLAKPTHAFKLFFDVAPPINIMQKMDSRTPP